MKRRELTILWAAAMVLVAAAPAPAPPTGLKARIAAGGIELSWQPGGDREGVTGYEAERGELLTGPFVPVGRAEAKSTTITDRSARPEHIYFYRVRTVGKNGVSAWTPEVSAEIPGRPP